MKSVAPQAAARKSSPGSHGRPGTRRKGRRKRESQPADPNDSSNDHTFTCDSGVGGDVVVEYTTGNAQTTLNFSGTIANYESSGYIRVEITDSPCASGGSDYCTASSSLQTDTGSITVTPNTTYYVWVTDGFSGHYLPDVDLCLNP